MRFNLQTLEVIGSPTTIALLGDVKQISEDYFFIVSQNTQGTQVGVYNVNTMSYVFTLSVANSLQIQEFIPLGYDPVNNPNIVSGYAYYDNASSQVMLFSFKSKTTQPLQIFNYGEVSLFQTAVDEVAILSWNAGFARTVVYKVTGDEAILLEYF